MPYIVNRNFSRYYDIRTETEFSPVLDLSSGCYVGVAQVDDAKAEEFDGREGFEVLDTDQYVALTVKPPTPAPTEPATGSALTDQVQATNPSQNQSPSTTSPNPPGPPAPPQSK